MNKKHKICSTNILRNIQDPKLVKLISTSGGTRYLLIEGNAGKLYLLRSITVAYTPLSEDKYEKAHKNFLQMSTTEFKSLQQLNSIESCVRTLEFDHIEEKAKKQVTCELLMDYPGELLSNLIKENFSKATLMKWGIQLCKGIKTAEEKGISHLNLRLDNIYIDSSKNIKISGFSTTQKLYSYLTKNPKKETIDYNNLFKPPESITSNSGGSDVYSIGIILYILLRGSLKPQGQELNICKLKEQDNVYIMQEINNMKDSDNSNNNFTNLKQIIRDCLEFSPAKRPNINQLLVLFQGEANPEKEEQKKIEKIPPIKTSQSDSKTISNSDIVNYLIQLLEKKGKYTNVTPARISSIIETMIDERDESKLIIEIFREKESKSDDDKAKVKNFENKIEALLNEKFMLEDKLKKSGIIINTLREQLTTLEKEKNEEIEKIHQSNQSNSRENEKVKDQTLITTISRLAKTVLPNITTSDPVEITKKLVEEINALKGEQKPKIAEREIKEFTREDSEGKKNKEEKKIESKVAEIKEEKANLLGKENESEPKLTDEISAILKQDEKWSFSNFQ